MRGQIAAEFIMYSMLGMIIVIIISGIIYDKYTEKKTEQTIYEATQLGRQIQKELIIASEVKKGYRRTIKLPSTILGSNYTIITYPSQIMISYKGTDQYFNTPLLSGNFMKGENNITTNETTIIIN